MAKKTYSKEDWFEFRKEILELVMLYKQIKEFTNFDINKIELIESFFHLSRKNAITSFYIKLGFLMSNGKPTFKDFLSHEDFNDLNGTYKLKLKDIRDKVYAHNAKSQLPSSLQILNEDVDLLYTMIISYAEKIDQKYEETFYYHDVINSEGIRSIEYFISNSIKYNELQEELLNIGNKAEVEMNFGGDILVKN